MSQMLQVVPFPQACSAWCMWSICTLLQGATAPPKPTGTCRNLQINPCRCAQNNTNHVLYIYIYIHCVIICENINIYCNKILLSLIYIYIHIYVYIYIYTFIKDTPSNHHCHSKSLLMLPLCSLWHLRITVQKKKEGRTRKLGMTLVAAVQNSHRKMDSVKRKFHLCRYKAPCLPYLLCPWRKSHESGWNSAMSRSWSLS